MEATKVVLIVGSGVAGLKCARTLKELDPKVEIIIVEGRDRIGGRVRTEKFGNCHVDLGASWIHGINGNPVYKLAKEVGFKISKISDSEKQANLLLAPKDNPHAWHFLAFDAQGKTYSEALEELDDAFQELLCLVGQQALSQKELAPHTNFEDAMLKATKRPAVNPKKANKSGKKNQQQNPNKNNALCFDSKFRAKHDDATYVKLWTASCVGEETYHAAPLARLSTHSVYDYGSRDEDGGNAYVIGGYKQLVDYLAKDLLDSIVLNQTVSSITTLPNGRIEVRTSPSHNVSQNSNDNAGAKDGRVFVADRIVVTVPLGVLKAQSIQFTPTLSRDKLNAIERMGMGNLNKIALQFSTLFWSPNASWFYYVSENKAEVMLFHSLFRKTGQPVCLAYLAPQFSVERLEKKLTEPEVVDLALETLSKYFGQLPRKHFVQGRATMWDQDPFALGSYSYIPFGEHGALYDVLALPEWDNRLFFAGESTYRDHPGTVDGAFSSGEREAGKVARSFAANCNAKK